MREALGRQPIPWFFGIPNNSCLSTTGVLVPATKRAKRSKAAKSSARLPLSGTDTQACNNSWIDDQHQYIKASELTWEEFLRGYALPNTHHRVDPLNQQRDIRWIPEDIPERTSSLGFFPRMRSNIIELVGRNQQTLLEPYGIYIESILTTLVITKQFGQQYSAFESSHTNMASRHGIGSSCMSPMQGITGP